ncbi:MAG: hypothetical protein KKA84_15675 [Bacteroidetes bacterium]|nr:hypothetical protein [Bacteroidota bacterium]
MTKVKKISDSDLPPQRSKRLSPKPYIKHRADTKSENKSSDKKKTDSLNRLELLKEKELNLMKSGFFSIISHEFRTPLTSILASADLLEIYGREWGINKYMEHINKIQRSVIKMTSLLDDVIVQNRSQDSKTTVSPQKINLKEESADIVKEKRRSFKPNQ